MKDFGPNHTFTCYKKAEILTIEKGNYAYYFTDTFPYSLRCFKGTPMMPGASATETPDLTGAQCPTIYEALRDNAALIRKSFRSSKDDEVARTQRSRTSAKNENSEIAGTIVDFVSTLANLQQEIKAPSIETFLENLQNRKRRSFLESFDNMDLTKHEYYKFLEEENWPHFQALYQGFHPMLEKCGFNGQEENTCLKPCSNKWADCDPDVESCIGDTGYYQKTITCPNIALKQVVPEAEQIRNLFNLMGS